MKKIILAIIGILAFENGYSQEEGKFRVGLDLGYAAPTNGGGGIMFSIEPKYNIKDNMNVGLRIGGAGMAREVESDGITISGNLSANGSYVATYDYYFSREGKTFVPYLGAGAGYYELANLEFDNVSSGSYQVDGNGKMGGLLRGGFEWSKFRMGLECNLVPKSTLKNTNGANVGSISNSYFGFHLGFYVGGGKWGK
jgi:hypothetical protein